MSRSVSLRKPFLVGTIVTISSFGWVYYYAERKMVVPIDLNLYLIGIAGSLGVAFLMSWFLSEPAWSEDMEKTEDVSSHDTAKKAMDDRLVQAHAESVKIQAKQLQATCESLKEQNANLINRLNTMEREKEHFDAAKNKVDQQSQELGKILAEKELMDLRLAEHQQKLTRDYDEKREQLEQEIARRKQIQGTLEANEHRYRTMIEGASDALILSSSAGVVEYASPASEELLGIASQDLLGSEVDYALPDEAKNVKLFIEKAINKSSIVYRVQCTKKDENPVVKYVSHHLSYLDIPGKRRILVHSLRDVSAIKLAETQKIDYEKQLFHASKLASLGTMGAGIAHELNNPLSVVKGFTEKVRLDLMATLGDSHGTIGHLDKILKQISRMRIIVDQLRIFSRKDSGYEMTLIPVDRLFNDALILQRHQLSGSRIALEVNIPENVPQIKVNLTHFESVIQNLVSNAYDAHLSRVEDASAQKEHRWIRLSYRTTDVKTVEILVEDNAGGIPKESLNKIFDPFFTTKGPGKGTGLGLALVQSIVADHQGTIQVTSEIGNGTCFKITLPQKENEDLGEVDLSA